MTRRKRRVRGLRLILLLTLTLLVVLVVWAFWWEPRQLHVRHEQLQIPGWTQPLRIAVLTDLHTGSPHNEPSKLSRIIDVTNAAQPDLIVLLGDFVIQGVLGGNFVGPEEIADSLRRLHAPLGVHAVLGNHDWWLDAPRVRAALRRAGITVLEDSALALHANNTHFWLGGVSDMWEGQHDVAATLRWVTDSAAVLLITHNPDIFPDVPARVALTIAGHTHGGQVKLPFIGAPVVPSRYGQRFAAGHIVEQDRHLFVATGTGTSILPVRFRVPPAVVVLSLGPSR
ncbi:MAG: metallophosphoesterase [Longimicrobiales bacterium]